MLQLDGAYVNLTFKKFDCTSYDALEEVRIREIDRVLQIVCKKSSIGNLWYCRIVDVIFYVRHESPSKCDYL